MKKKTVTVLAIEYSKRVCDPQPELIAVSYTHLRAHET